MIGARARRIARTHPFAAGARLPELMMCASFFATVVSVPPERPATFVTQLSGYSGGTNVAGYWGCSRSMTRSSCLRRIRCSTARSAMAVISWTFAAGCAMTRTVMFSAPAVMRCPTSASTGEGCEGGPLLFTYDAMTISSAESVGRGGAEEDRGACAEANARVRARAVVLRTPRWPFTRPRPAESSSRAPD